MTTKFTQLLTEEEFSEFMLHPPGKFYENMNIELRTKIAQKMEDFVNKEDHELPEEYRTVYEQYPRWKFYTDKNNGVIKRTFGLCKYDDGTFGMHTYTCFFGFVNETVGGTPVKDLVPIDKWTDEQLLRINLNQNKGLFIDPLAWLCIASKYAQ